MVPTFVLVPFDGVGARLCPWGIAMGTPQFFPMASWPSFPQRLRSRPPCGRAPLFGPDPPGWSRSRVERLYSVGFSRTPFHLACRARAVWRCQGAPALSGPLAAFPCASRVRLPSAFGRPLRRPTSGALSSPPGTRRRVAHTKSRRTRSSTKTFWDTAGLTPDTPQLFVLPSYPSGPGRGIPPGSQGVYQ
jgi:hypothetical protein